MNIKKFLVIALIILPTYSYCADFNIIDGLFNAIEQNEINAFNKILNSETVNCIHKYKANYTPIIFAAVWDRKEMVEILLKNKANINAQSKNGETALMLAVREGYRDIVEILLKYGADCTLKNWLDKTALMIAKQNMNINANIAKEIIDMLSKYTEGLSTDTNAEEEELTA